VLFAPDDRLKYDDTPIPNLLKVLSEGPYKAQWELQHEVENWFLVWAHDKVKANGIAKDISAKIGLQVHGVCDVLRSYYRLSGPIADFRMIARALMLIARSQPRRQTAEARAKKQKKVARKRQRAARRRNRRR